MAVVVIRAEVTARVGDGETTHHPLGAGDWNVEENPVAVVVARSRDPGRPLAGIVVVYSDAPVSKAT
jgi:hypothetical protein